MGSSMNRTYENLVKGAAEGDPACKWFLHKLDLADLVMALRTIANMDDEGISEFAKVMASIAMSSKKNKQAAKDWIVSINGKLNNALPLAGKIVLE